MHVLGREAGDGGGPTAAVGWYRTRDGTRGAAVGVDVDRPHAALVVGKRGYGKSYTLGVLGEELSRARGVAPVVVDPVGALTGLGAARGRVVERPTVRADSVPPRAWPELVGLDPEGAAGGLVWRAASERATLAGMCRFVSESSAVDAARRAAVNHLELAETWAVFDPDGLDAETVTDPSVTVLDCSERGRGATGAVVAGVARALYAGRLSGAVDCLPWLVVDEAHVVTDGVAGPALRTLLTRGRAPGVSLVLATQRPAALPDVATSQADLVVAHRLTAADDVAALERCEATYVEESLRRRLPSDPGEAVVVDDSTEAVHGVSIRQRETPHGGATPRASRVASPPRTETRPEATGANIESDV